MLKFEDGKNPAIVPLVVCLGSILGWFGPVMGILDQTL